MIRHAWVVGLVLGAAAAGRADDAKSIVAKGLKACGWDKEKSPYMTWKDSGKFSGGGMEMTYSGDWAVQLPDKYRFAIKVKFGEMSIDFTHVLNGDKAFESAAGMTQDVEGEKLKYTKNQVFSMWVQSLAPLLTDPAFKLKDVPGKDEGGKPTAGVQVDREGKPPMTLYFDKASGLLVRTDLKTINEFDGWKECTDESHLSDWKDVGNGVKAFHKLKIVRDGKTMIESDMSDFKRPEKLDAKLFEKP
jgi:hypothetical protein